MRIDHHLSDAQLERAALRSPWNTGADGPDRALLYRVMHEAIGRELTARQGQYLADYYFTGCSMEQVARRYGVNRSTVCRQLQAARRRLETPLRYALLAQGEQERES